MEADGGALCIDALTDKTGQEISFHRRGSIDCGVACSKLAYWNSIEHASPGGPFSCVSRHLLGVQSHDNDEPSRGM